MLVLTPQSATVRAKQKPQARGPAEAVQRDIRLNAERVGIDPPIVYAPTWEGAGPYPNDVMGFLDGTSTIDSTGCSWEKNKFSITNGDAGRIQEVNGGLIKSVGTFIFRGLRNDSSYNYGSDFYALSFREYGKPNSGVVALSTKDAGGKANVEISGPDFRGQDTGYNLPWGEFQDMTVSWDGSNIDFYVGPSFYYQKAYSTAFTTDTSFNLYCYETSNRPTTPWIGLVDYGIYFNYVLKPPQIALLSDHPYLLLQRNPARTWFIPSGSALPTPVNLAGSPGLNSITWTWESGA